MLNPVQFGRERGILIAWQQLLLEVTLSETLEPQEVLLAKILHSKVRAHVIWVSCWKAISLLDTDLLLLPLPFPAFFFSPRLMSVAFSTFFIAENEPAVFFPYIHYRINSTKGPALWLMCVWPGLSHRFKGCQGWQIHKYKMIWKPDAFSFMNEDGAACLSLADGRIVSSHEIN